MSRKKKEKIVKKSKDSNVVIKTGIEEDTNVLDALKIVSVYCEQLREKNECEKCMFSTVLFMEGTQTNHAFCDLKGKRPCDYKGYSYED